MGRSNSFVLRSKRFSNSLERDTRLIFRQHELWMNFCPGTYYASTGRRKAVPLTPELRAQTLETIAAVRTLLSTGQRPEVGYSPRCKGCSVHNICLPRETALLRQQGECGWKGEAMSTLYVTQ